MIEYHNPVFRPPAEANSFILQITLGCSYNKCSFCSMYETKKFQVRALEDIFSDIDKMAFYDIRRVFLADGDALVCETSFLLEVLKYLKKVFPKLQRVSTYASAYNLMKKSQEELELLREHGLSLVYYGLESGSEELLKYVNKAFSSEKLIESLNKASKAKMKLSVTIILGLGGKTLSSMHIEKTAKLLNECLHINYLSTLQLGLTDTKEQGFFQRFEEKNSEFIPCSDEDILKEQKLLISLLNPKKSIIFRSNHASNALALKGTLPKDRDVLLEQLDYALEDETLLRPSFLRAF